MSKNESDTQLAYEVNGLMFEAYVRHRDNHEEKILIASISRHVLDTPLEEEFVQLVRKFVGGMMAEMVKQEFDVEKVEVEFERRDS